MTLAQKIIAEKVASQLSEVEQGFVSAVEHLNKDHGFSVSLELRRNLASGTNRGPAQ